MTDTPPTLTRVAQYSEQYSSIFFDAMTEVAHLVGHQGDLNSPQSVGKTWLEDPVFALASVTWYGFTIQDPAQQYWCLAARVIGEIASRRGLYTAGKYRKPFSLSRFPRREFKP